MMVKILCGCACVFETYIMRCDCLVLLIIIPEYFVGAGPVVEERSAVDDVTSAIERLGQFVYRRCLVVDELFHRRVLAQMVARVMSRHPDAVPGR